MLTINVIIIFRLFPILFIVLLILESVTLLHLTTLQK